MESPAADSPIQDAGGSGIDLESSPGIMNFQAREHRALLLRFACEIAAVGRNYRAAHQAQFGMSLRRVLNGIRPAPSSDLASMAAHLESIRVNAVHIEGQIRDSCLVDLPRRSKLAVAFRDALLQYAQAISDASGRLRNICISLNKEKQGEKDFAAYRETRLKDDRAAYDASVQEFRRWGGRLTELTERL